MSEFLSMLKETFLDNIYLLFVFGVFYYIAMFLSKAKENTNNKKIQTDSASSVQKSKKNISEVLSKKNYINEDNKFLVGDTVNQTQNEFENEIEDIVHQVDDGKQIKVPLVKAMYILRRYDKHNVFASEDGRIIMDKLKKIYDEDGNEISTKIDLVEKNKQGSTKLIGEKKDENVTTDEDGNFIVYNPNGYTKISTEGRIVASVNYAKEEAKKKKEEGGRGGDSKLKQQLSETEEAVYAIQKKLIEEQQKKNSVEEKNKTENNSTDITPTEKNKPIVIPEKSEVNSILDKFKTSNIISPKEDDENLEESVEGENIESEILDIESEKNSSQIYFTEDKFDLPVLFENKISDEYIKSCITQLEKENVSKFLSLFFKSEIASDGKIVYVDIDLERGTYLVNVNLFMLVFSYFLKMQKEYQDKKFHKFG